MNKFGILMKKETKELFTLQMLLPVLFTIVLFIILGSMVGNETKKSQQIQKVILFDYDRTEISKLVSEKLTDNGFSISNGSGTVDNAIGYAQKNGISNVIVIPQGFTSSIEQGYPVMLDVYTMIRDFSAMSLNKIMAGKTVIETINNEISRFIITNQFKDRNPDNIIRPVEKNDFVIINNLRAKVDPQVVSGFLQSQTIFIPIILFIVIVSAANIVAAAVATEKENKTLETLLTTPVSRASIVTAKMSAAGLVSLVSAIIYMFGLSFYLNSFNGSQQTSAFNNIKNALICLRLALSLSDYILLALSVFCSILIALSISLLIGVFAEDVKKVQGLIMPVILLILIPYFMTMILDINTISPAVRYLIWAIPFSHPFIASKNLFMHDYPLVIFGIIYQAFVLSILIYTDIKVFSTDSVITMKMNINNIFAKKKHKQINTTSSIGK